MKQWKAYGLGLVALAGLCSGLYAQFGGPLAPPSPSIGNGAIPQPTDPTAPAGMITKLQAQLKFCKEKLCKTQLGLLLSNGYRIPSTLAGGVLGQCCPPGPSPTDLAKPGAEGEAAKIQKLELEAKARRAAVRYLSTVDCHFFPEAADALIGALRTDTNECVRWEAAMALGTGCCCSRKTMEALLITVTCSNKDGNPSETSPRVRAAAMMSLQHCLNCVCESQVVKDGKGEEKPLEKPRKLEKGKPEAAPAPTPATMLQGQPVHGLAYYQNLGQCSMEQLASEGRRALDEARSQLIAATPVPAARNHDLISLINDAMLPGPVVMQQTTIEEGAVVHDATHETSAVRPAFVPGSGPSVAPSTSGVTPIRYGAAETTEPRPVVAPTKAAPRPTVPMWPKPTPTQQQSSVPAANTATSVASGIPSAIPYAPASVAAAPAPSQPFAPAKLASAIAPVQPSAPVMLASATTSAPARASAPVTLASAKTSSTTFAPASIAAAPSPAMPFAPAAIAAAAPTPNYRPTQTSAVPATQPRSADASASSGPGVPMLLTVLRNSVNPFQREWAVDSLATCDWRGQTDVANVVIKAAREDSAATVRAACARCLGGRQMNTPQVVSTLQALKTDPDPRVQHAATEALQRLNSRTATAAPANPGFVGRAN
jgi:hypothetical protein